MGIIRIKKEKNFSVISNRHLKDRRLSLKAKGLLTVLLSKPDDWQVYVTHLITISKDGKDAHYTALKELIKAGYIITEKIRNPKGRITGTQYTIYENSISPEMEVPETENPNMVIPDKENQEQLKTDNTYTDHNQKRTTASRSDTAFNFDNLNLKFDNASIRNLIIKYVEKNGSRYVKEATAYANEHALTSNASSFKVYLSKILENSRGEDYGKYSPHKQDTKIVDFTNLVAIEVGGTEMPVRDEVARDKNGSPIYASGMIVTLISKGKARPIYRKGIEGK